MFSAKPGELLVVGFDPSLRNWGVAVGSLHPVTGHFTLLYLDVIQPVLPEGKSIRQNSLDLEAAKQLYAGAYKYAKYAHAIFVEVPVGSQSARAMAGYAICVGVLGSLRSNGIPFFELNPNQIKQVTGIKNATKKQMINWAVDLYPDSNWPRYVKKGITFISESNAEHMADAVAAIHAGCGSNDFKQYLTLKKESYEN